MARNLFEELTEGFDSLAADRLGKLTLRKTRVAMPAITPVTAADVMRLREQMQLSRAVFARYLRINERTLENWEQGRAKPNAQATVLLSLVKKYPDTVERLATL